MNRIRTIVSLLQKKKLDKRFRFTYVHIQISMVTNISTSLMHIKNPSLTEFKLIFASSFTIIFNRKLLSPRIIIKDKDNIVFHLRSVFYKKTKYLIFSKLRSVLCI